MPSKIVIDTISNLDDFGKVVFSDGVNLDASSCKHILLPSISSQNNLITDDTSYIGMMKWNPEEKSVEYLNNFLNWTILSFEEDYDNLPTIGSVIFLDTYDNFSYLGSGNQWSNLSKYADISLSNQNGVFYQSSEKAFTFNSTDQYFVVDPYFTTFAMENGTGSTYSFWFKANSTLNYGSGQGDKLLFSVNDDLDGTNTSAILQIGINPSGGIYYDDDNITAATIGSTNYNDDQWHNLTITRPYGSGGQTSNFYIDGISIGTLSGTNPSYSNGDVVLLGARLSTTDLNSVINFYGGEISFVLISERAISETEVLNIYNETKYRYGL